MGMYDTFGTDQEIEQSGFWADYGDFAVRIASAGQGNARYQKYAEKKLKPVRRAIQTESLDTNRASSIMADIYANTIILDWRVKVKGKDHQETMQQGIEGPKGEILPFTVENVTTALLALPALFLDIQNQAAQTSNFRKVELEAEAGNS